MSFSGLMFRIRASRSDAKRDANLTVPADIDAVYDLNYAGNHDKYNNFDIYRPKNASGPLPVIVSIHGGGYVYGTKKVYQYYGMSLAQRGFAFINFNYHLAPRVRFPSPLVETNSMLSWLCEHAAEYELDMNNVILVGDSAGAQLASHYAAIKSDHDFAKLFPFTVPDFELRALGLNCGLYDLRGAIRQSRERSRRSTIFDDYFGGKPEAFGEMTNVLEYIHENYPPSFPMSASHDFLRDMAQPMCNHLLSRGVEAVCRIYGSEEQTHMRHVCHVNMNLPEATVINDEECDFFRRHLA